MNTMKVTATVARSLVTSLRQPSTVLGLSALIGALTAMITGQISWQGAVPAIAGALAAIALPDNVGAQAAIKDAADAAVRAEQAIAARRMGAAGIVSPGTSSAVSRERSSSILSSRPQL